MTPIERFNRLCSLYARAAIRVHDGIRNPRVRCEAFLHRLERRDRLRAALGRLILDALYPAAKEAIR